MSRFSFLTSPVFQPSFSWRCLKFLLIIWRFRKMGVPPIHPFFGGFHFRKPSSQFYSAACGLRFGIQDLPVYSAGNCHRFGITMCTVYICVYIYIYQIYMYILYIYYIYIIYILYIIYIYILYIYTFGKTIQVQIQPQPTSPARTDLRRRLRWLAMARGAHVGLVLLGS